MASAKGFLKLGKKDPSPHRHCNEDSIGKKRTAKGSNGPSNSPEECPQSPRTPITPGHPTKASYQWSQHHKELPTAFSQNSGANKSQQSIAQASMSSIEVPVMQPSNSFPGASPSVHSKEQLPGQQWSLSRSSSSKKSPNHSPILGRLNPRNGIEPFLDHRTKSGRATSQERKEPKEGKEGKEVNFMDRVKASRQAAQQAAQTYGGKAAKITAKATASTAKAIGEKGQRAWGKIVTKTKSSKDGLLQHANHHSHATSPQNKLKKPTIDVWGMSIRDATLKTRIAKEKLSEADSTAYWTPAVAFRCLQYLNVHGPQELGLYRVSGSTAVVDELRAEFVNYHDVDLFDNPPNDIHTVTSLLKGYFRALPDPLLPTEAQKRIYEEIKDFQEEPVKPPQCFLDELSRLPPYNYYMLYSLSAHLSNVNKQSDVNKMNLSNLGMIFCSTLRIDRPCFNWLVASWADCWQGCWTEHEEIEKTDPNILSKKTPSELGLASPAPSSGFLSSTSSPSLSHAPPSPAPGSIHSVSRITTTTPAEYGSTGAPSDCSAATLNAQQGDSGSPMLHQPESPFPSRLDSFNTSVPSTPYTPASFTIGDDQRFMGNPRPKNEMNLKESIAQSPSSASESQEDKKPKELEAKQETLKLEPPPHVSPKEGPLKCAKIDMPLSPIVNPPELSNSTEAPIILPLLTPVSPLIAEHR